MGGLKIRQAVGSYGSLALAPKQIVSAHPKKVC